MIPMEKILDLYDLNKFTVDHKITDFELLKLKEVLPAYGETIKETLSKKLSRQVLDKTTFTKRHDKDNDIHHFIGRVWVFSEEELKNLIHQAVNEYVK